MDAIRDQILTMNSWLVYLLLFVITFIIASILMRLSHASQKLVEQVKNTSPKKSSRFGFLSAIFLLLLLSVTIFFSAFIRSYHAFTKKELVAIVKCYPPQSKNANFDLTLITIVDGAKEDSMRFPIKGNQWALGGDILKWDDVVNFLGLHTMYRLTRLEGRYARAADQSEKPSTVYALGKEEQSPVWRMLYTIGHRLPFVTSVYGNTVFNYPAFGSYFKVYVTTSGFITERVEARKESLSHIVINELLDMMLPKRTRDEVQEE